LGVPGGFRLSTFGGLAGTLDVDYITVNEKGQPPLAANRIALFPAGALLWCELRIGGSAELFALPDELIHESLLDWISYEIEDVHNCGGFLIYFIDFGALGFQQLSKWCYLVAQMLMELYGDGLAMPAALVEAVGAIGLPVEHHEVSPGRHNPAGFGVIFSCLKCYQ